MRALATLTCFLALTTAAHARPKHRDKDHGRAKAHATHASKKQIARAHHHITIHGPIEGQSVGAPWDGQLREAARLPGGDGYVIRRPWRSYGTRATVDFVDSVVTDWREQFPDAHVLAIGDISAEHGGTITEHHSHQSGRDVDIGLVYKEKPDGYPASFIPANEDNLDAEATFSLLWGFAQTSDRDGGAQVIFLDFNVQGILYHWAKEHDVDDDTLSKLFQYPHGRGSSEGLVRHEPNHDNHMHVRFKCPRGDSACR